MSRSSGSSSVGKWVAGILASIIAAVAIWWLTREGGPLNPAPEKPAPTGAIVITDAFFGEIFAAAPIDATFTIYNQGDTAAEECGLYWSSEYLASGVSIQNAWPAQPIFGLPPGASRTLAVHSEPLGDPGEYTFRYTVACARHASRQYEHNMVAR
jgi:hypothetical protein